MRDTPVIRCKTIKSYHHILFAHKDWYSKGWTRQSAHIKVNMIENAIKKPIVTGELLHNCQSSQIKLSVTWFIILAIAD